MGMVCTGSRMGLEDLRPGELVQELLQTVQVVRRLQQPPGPAEPAAAPAALPTAGTAGCASGRRRPGACLRCGTSGRSSGRGRSTARAWTAAKRRTCICFLPARGPGRGRLEASSGMAAIMACTAASAAGTRGSSAGSKAQPSGGGRLADLVEQGRGEALGGGTACGRAASCPCAAGPAMISGGCISSRAISGCSLNQASQAEPLGQRRQNMLRRHGVACRRQGRLRGEGSANDLQRLREILSAKV